MPRFYLSAVAMFRNESGILREWIAHHRRHGVDHLYLINDESSDDYLPIVEPYIKEGYVTLFQSDMPRYQHRQDKIYNKHCFSLLPDSVWVVALDLDEFLYSPMFPDLRVLLRALEKEDISQVFANLVWFGSSGHVRQPDGVVANFTKRAEYGALSGDGNRTNGVKSIARTDKMQWIGMWSHWVRGPSVNLSWEKDRENPMFLVNHYAIQSKEFCLKNKKIRGDADGVVRDRGEEYFKAWDFDDVADERLKRQNSE